MEEYIYPRDHNPDFLSILVPNVDNVRTDYLIQIVSKQGKVGCQVSLRLSVELIENKNHPNKGNSLSWTQPLHPGWNISPQ